MSIKTFSQVLEECKKNGFKKNLLLGNGFSIAYNKEIFSYDKLFEYSDMSENVKGVFKEFNTYDFEIIIKKFTEAHRLFKKYKPDNKIAEELLLEANNIKEKLVNSISEKHPNSQFEISENRIFNTLIFLSNFDNIFSLNYDLLLYWVLMNKNDLKNKHPKIKHIYDMNDGFHRNGHLTWGYKKKLQNVFYLHGALHLIDEDIKIIKIENRENSNLISIIQSYLEANCFPLIVAEGSSNEKLIKIKHNEYLNYCYNSLSCIEGNLVIYGHSLADNDEHILKQIAGNINIKNIYVSVHDPENNYETISEKALNIFRKRIDKTPLKLNFFDAGTTNVWSNNSLKDM